MARSLSREIPPTDRGIAAHCHRKPNNNAMQRTRTGGTGDHFRVPLVVLHQCSRRQT